MKLRRIFATSSAMIAAVLSTGCVGAGISKPPVVAVPELQEYSRAFELKFADELDALPDECGRDVVVPPCSALHTFTLDAIRLREQVRTAE